MVCRLVIFLGFALSALSAPAQAKGSRSYTKEQPLVYEDPQDLWPYSFLNDQGEPDGFNIDLARMILDELHIPYVIRLKPLKEVLQDLRDGKSDLTLGPTSVFYNSNSHYGRHTITLLTQSVATPTTQAMKVSQFRDLGNQGQQVIVNDSGLCHHLMIDYGWQANAVPTSDMGKAIRQLNESREGQIVWNTLSLKWLISHYQLDNLTLTPVNMPYGKYRYMSDDQQLLDRVDKAYAALHAAEKLSDIERKWFYPERNGQEVVVNGWYIAGLALLLVAITSFIIQCLVKNRRVSKEKDEQEKRLAAMLQASHVRIWSYNVGKGTFSWAEEEGAFAIDYTAEEFAKRYSKEDARLLKEAINRLAKQQKDARGHVEIETTLELRAKDAEYGDLELRNFVVTLYVRESDSSGRPSVITALKRDVTKEYRFKQANVEHSLRFWSIFFNDETGIAVFDKEGYIQNANPKACQLFQCDIDKVVEDRVHINQFLHTDFADLEDANGFAGSLTVGNHTIEYQVKTACGDDKKLLSILVFCL